VLFIPPERAAVDVEGDWFDIADVDVEVDVKGAEGVTFAFPKLLVLVLDVVGGTDVCAGKAWIISIYPLVLDLTPHSLKRHTPVSCPSHSEPRM
jgi:hypothetical protein